MSPTDWSKGGGGRPAARRRSCVQTLNICRDAVEPSVREKWTTQMMGRRQNAFGPSCRSIRLGVELGPVVHGVDRVRAGDVERNRLVH